MTRNTSPEAMPVVHRIAVGAVTRRRPAKLDDLLQSFSRLEVPDGTEIKFFVVENDDSKASSDVVDAFRASVAAPVRYDLEMEPGIPFARNAVLDAALEEGMDYLTFVDDDEVVRPDWLVELYNGMIAHDLDLAGGPVHVVSTDEELSAWNRASLEFFREKLQKRNVRRVRLKNAGVKDNGLRIYTNNWCVRLEAVRKFGLRFDEALRFAGGSDTRFSVQAAQAGARVGWIASAIVEEPISKSRLTPTYQFQRTRDQASMSVQIRRVGKAQCWLGAAKRVAEAIPLTLLALFKGRVLLLKAWCNIAEAIGRVKGSFGVKSHHYSEKSKAFHVETGAGE